MVLRRLSAEYMLRRPLSTKTFGHRTLPARYQRQLPVLATMVNTIEVITLHPVYGTIIRLSFEIVLLRRSFRKSPKTD